MLLLQAQEQAAADLAAGGSQFDAQTESGRWLEVGGCGWVGLQALLQAGATGWSSLACWDAAPGLQQASRRLLLCKVPCNSLLYRLDAA